MTKSYFVIWLFFLFLVLPVVFAAPVPQSSGTIKVEVRLIEVYATIYDQKGRYVDGLSRNSFQVFDDGMPEEIANFETSGQSLSCAILLDTTGSMAEALPRVKNSIVKLIDELGPQDSVAIYTFDERLTVRQEFTTDKDAAKRAILRTRAQGRTALFDALSQVAQDISKRPGKKTLIVFTDGDDNSSKKLLEDLSQRTGGSAYQVNKSSDIDQVFHKIAQDLQHLYMISYQPPSAPADEKWHKINLSVKGLKDYRVRAKEGYFPD